jgi:hypothetical protein
VMGTTLAAAATTAGLWTSPTAYIEFNPGFAGYAASGSGAPTGPASYFGFILPEPSGVGLMVVGLAGVALRRRRR